MYNETKINLLRHVRRSEFNTYPLRHEQINDVAVSVQTCWQLCVPLTHSLTIVLRVLNVNNIHAGILDQE